MNTPNRRNLWIIFGLCFIAAIVIGVMMPDDKAQPSKSAVARPTIRTAHAKRRGRQSCNRC